MFKQLVDPLADKTVAPFCLDATEVTGDAYTACVTSGACKEPSPYDSGQRGQKECNWKHPEGRGRHPINCVTWNDADTFCRWKQKRLPLNYEWEWAARSGDKAFVYPWGNEAPDEKRVNACGSECPPHYRDMHNPATMYRGNDGFRETAPVGSFPLGDNIWGVHDLSGNVSEWTGSLFEVETPGAREVRGGNFYESWVNSFGDAPSMMATSNSDTLPSKKGPGVGFRCAS